MSPRSLSIAAALLGVLCVTQVSFALSLSAEATLQNEISLRYDQCRSQVQTRCHDERERCGKDCEMYSETSAKCAADKCSLLHRACHRLYSEACDDGHPVNWVPLGDIQDKVQEKLALCKERVSKQCSDKFTECRKVCDEEIGSNKCNAMRCEIVQSECIKELGTACNNDKTLLVVDQTPGRYCIEHAKTCKQQNTVTPQIIDTCENDCVQRKSWSDVTSCDECTKTITACYDNCKGGLCQPQSCIREAEGCRLKCPMIKAFTVGNLKMNNLARTSFVKPITEASLA